MICVMIECLVLIDTSLTSIFLEEWTFTDEMIRLFIFLSTRTSDMSLGWDIPCGNDILVSRVIQENTNIKMMHTGIKLTSYWDPYLMSLLIKV